MAKRISKIFVLLLLSLLLAAVVALLWLRSSGLPARDGEHVLAAIDASVTVRWDRWGVPAVVAASESDLIAAQGWLHANDRLTQMEIGRRAAAGRLAELFGEAALDTDIYFRTLRIEQAIDAMEAQLSARSRRWLEAYARGVNAWLAERGSDLPPGLRLLGVDPEPWQIRDSLAFVLLMARDLSFWNGRPEEERFRWLRALGAGTVRELLADPHLHVPPEIAALAADPAFEPAAAADLGVGGPLASPGSNNWAVGPSRSAQGHAMLANDPHLGLNLPAIWYQVMLRSPGYEAAGMSLPGAPGVVIGRGPHVAWALTNVMLDDHDVFFEQLDESGERYLRGERWLPIEFRQETIVLRGGEERLVEFRATDIGPLLAADSELGLPPRSLAWTAYYGGDPFATFGGLAAARTVAEVRAAVASYFCPAQNLVVAFDSGELFYTVIGRVPARRRGDGRLPSPGWLQEYGWDGLRSPDSNPWLSAPAEDFLATANSDIRPAGYELPLTADFYQPFRHRRIADRLSERRDWSVANFAELQGDVVSLYADRLIATLDDDYPDDAGLAAAELRNWDRAHRQQGTAALFALFERSLRQAIFVDEAEAAGLRRVDDSSTTVRLLEGKMVELWFDDVTTVAVEERRQVVAASLAEAWLQGVERWGGEVAQWDYGSIHQLTLTHPLDPLPLFGRWARRGPFELPGTGAAINAFAGPWRGDIQQIGHGPSMRWIVDWSQPEKVFAGLPGGQSGHPADVHYSDRLQPYLAGELQEFGWSEAEIEARTTGRLKLVPGP